MFDLALTLVVSVLLILAAGVSIWALPWKDEDLAQASRGVTGVINLGLIAIGAIMFAGMILS